MPCRLVKVNQHFIETYHLCLQCWRISPAKPNRKQATAASFFLISFLTYPLTLKMKVICSSEMLVDFHWNSQLYIQADIILDNNMILKMRVLYINWALLEDHIMQGSPGTFFLSCTHSTASLLYPDKFLKCSKNTTWHTHGALSWKVQVSQ